MKLPIIAKPTKKINWKKRLWKVFSEWVRRSENGKCFTCSAQKDWKETDAGHYVNAGSSPPPLYFDERNVHCQCDSCNRFKSGNKTVYALRLQQKYGSGILEELEIMRNRGGKWSDWTYKIKIDEYKQKLKILN